MKRIAVIFDLDETIGYFSDVSVFIEAYEKYRNKHISDEEKKLVESMTRFMDSMASEHFEDDDE